MEYPIETIPSSAFPRILTEIDDPPKTLYLRGVMPPAEYKWLCVVGSRKFSNYGRDVATELIHGLRGYPVVIVSGLALGMDGIAHRAALDAELPTIAVPGSGLHDSVLYPATHYPLAQEILRKGGALLSEFEPKWKPRPESFPQRNRIMAGLSHAVFVIEAESRSGTLITSRLAAEYNRDVLTVPHPISSATGEGPHMLMRLGAVPIRTSTEILEALGIDADERTTKQVSANTVEGKVLELLREPIQKDLLIQALGLSTREANVLISTMELKGLVRETAGYVAKV